MGAFRIHTLDRQGKGETGLTESGTNNALHKEYMQAVKEVKLDHMFSKPFVCSLGSHVEGITKIAKSRTEDGVFASIDYSGEINVWNMHARENTKTLKAPKEGNASLAFMDSALLYSHGSQVYIDREDRETPTQFVCGSAVLDLVQGPSASFFAATVDGIEMFDQERIKAVSVYKTDRQIKKIVYNDKTHLVYGIEGTRIVGYDLRTHSRAFTIKEQTEVHAVSISPEQDTRIVAGLNCGNLHIYNVMYPSAPERVYRGHASPVLGIEYSPSGKHILTGSLDRTVRVFNNDLTHTQENIYHNKRMLGVNAVSCTNDGNYVLSGSVDGNLRVWKINPNYSLKVLTRKEEESRVIGTLLKEKYRDVAQVSSIRRHKPIPRKLKGDIRDRFAHLKRLERAKLSSSKQQEEGAQ
ncbi:DDB1- and CUL4-associated factor 13 [Nematocida sp. AWRm77]|nr:DDB1- and CUL4-associated factor 13 [Nematocida sp. AWRm77]